MQGNVVVDVIVIFFLILGLVRLITSILDPFLCQVKRKVLPADGRLMTYMERTGRLRRAQLREVITSQNVTSFFGTSWHPGHGE